MWFKNLRIYRLRDGAVINPDSLEQQLQTLAFTPCHKTQSSSMGWQPPLKGTDHLVHHGSGCIMLCARREEKLLPAAVVNEHLQQKLADLEQERGHKIGARDKARLKDEVVLDLLPRAFSRHRQLFAYVDRQRQLLIINTTSSSQCEALIELLRDSIGPLGLVPLHCQQSPASLMTHWVQTQQASHGFALADECELINPREDSNRVRCRGQDLTAEEVATHLQSGKQVRKLALTWQDQLGCMINDDLSISRLRFEDIVTDQAADGVDDSAAAQFEQDFAVMTMTLGPFIDALCEAFGGISDSE